MNAKRLVSSSAAVSNATWSPVAVEVTGDHQLDDFTDYAILTEAASITLPANPSPGRRLVVLMEAVSGVSHVQAGAFPLSGGASSLAFVQGEIFWFIFGGEAWFFTQN